MGVTRPPKTSSETVGILLKNCFHAGKKGSSFDLAQDERLMNG
jgi:hypothetical protein